MSPIISAKKIPTSRQPTFESDSPNFLASPWIFGVLTALSAGKFGLFGVTFAQPHELGGSDNVTTIVSPTATFGAAVLNPASWQSAIWL